MAKRYRQDSAQLNLRLKPAERDRIRAFIPRGSLNAVAIQLLLDYTHLLEARCQTVPGETQSACTQLPREGSAA